VMETVGAATWSHSLRSLKPGGRMVISGATSGFNPDSTELNRIFFLQLSIVGSTMGTRQELQDLTALLISTGLRPHIDRTLPMADIADGLRAIESGELLGKIVVTI
jgi:D-arabinose 1-dehydrogenase-like Zn-dependent alcohol dehydrogenase